MSSKIYDRGRPNNDDLVETSEFEFPLLDVETTTGDELFAIFENYRTVIGYVQGTSRPYTLFSADKSIIVHSQAKRQGIIMLWMAIKIKRLMDENEKLRKAFDDDSDTINAAVNTLADAGILIEEDTELYTIIKKTLDILAGDKQ